RVLRRGSSSIAESAGADNLSEKAGLQRTLGGKPISQTIGLIVYVLVLIPVLIAALNALKIESVTAPASNMLNIILQALPAIFAAGIILLISYLISRIVAGLVTSVLSSIGFDGLPARLGLWREPQEGEKTPSQVLGWITLIVIMLFAAIEAANVLGFGGVQQLLVQMTEILGHVLFGLAIFLTGIVIANAAGTAVSRSNIPQHKVATFATKASILVLTGAVALRQMGLANEIIVLGFGLFFGAIAVGTAIAFGVGGRDIAARKLEEWTQDIEEGDSDKK
ncbi:MAG: mechanosensitive ion channel, partial [Lentisphaeria bacterium]